MPSDQSCRLSLTLGQDSFALNSQKSTTEVFGTIHLTSDSTRFKAPSWTQIRLVGKERVAGTCKTFLDDTYHLSNQPTDWVSITSKECRLPFTLSCIPNNIPNSFHMETSTTSVYVYYTLIVTVSTCIDQRLLQPIYFYRTCYPDAQKVIILPKRTFWGITNQSKQQRWQYELEFPNTIHLDAACESISIRLKSMFPSQKSDCCLVGYQIIQLVHLVGEEPKSQHQVLATGTRLLTLPNKTWSQPCQFTFALDDATVLPTVMESQRAAIEHYVKFTFAFCNLQDEHEVNVEFPVNIMGCTSCMITSHMDQVQLLETSSNTSCDPSVDDEMDSAIDVSSFKSSCSDSNYLMYRFQEFVSN
ncbi:hypothetical protein HMPREF1544_00723 [Mucor circinelloides 1006PhL]|uniref:Arrestin-like N-terminal domain-containing protein n=1 Tax=Mucor circinelloides f. circinelloides (strain 1006PhL) TaxID=1220926 RepID=S2KJ31_MUCC1|nr:hypothetical protein HMPREF1544_00723 [Mucor circinelloides 1006PhL]KAG1106204.1 hypothetical protein G6F42_016842 [Rhizopus arrhizus]